MITTWLPVIIGVLGIAGTLVAYFFNPKKKLWDEMDKIYDALEISYAKRDKALLDHDSETATIADSEILALKLRKKVLKERLGI